MTEVKRRKRAHDEDVADLRGGDDGQARGNQSLPVAILPVNFNGIPEDGAQYLAVVRKQAHAFPSIVRVEAPDARSAIVEEAAVEASLENDDAILLPLPSWRTTFLQRFRNMRNSLRNRPAPDGGAQIGVPSGSSARKWFSYLHGRGPIVAGAETNDTSTTATLRTPSVALLQHLRTAQILALLAASTVWLEEGWQFTSEGGGGDSAAESTAIRPFHSQWLFSALAHLEERLVGDDISTLRSLARACIERIRRARALRQGKCDFAVESSAWIVVCAIAGIWGQHDLWQDAEDRLLSLQLQSDL